MIVMVNNNKMRPAAFASIILNPSERPTGAPGSSQINHSCLYSGARFGALLVDVRIET